MTGWYFWRGQTEYFIESKQQRKTDRFAVQVLNACGLAVNNYSIHEAKNRLQKATLEIKHSARWNKYYYSISGENFSGRGSDDVNDGKTIIIKL